jgi:transketolase
MHAKLYSLYPSDSVSTEKLVALIADHHGNCYLRTTRADTPVLYNQNDTFRIGGSKTLKISDQDEVTVIGAGITLHEALKAYDHLQGEGISIRVIDLYSIKPLDVEAIQKASSETKALIVVEDHYQEGGIYEAVCGSGVVTVPTHSLCVRKMTRSGTPEELLAYAEIDAAAIINKVKTITQN